MLQPRSQSSPLPPNATSEGLGGNGTPVTPWQEISGARFFSLLGLPFIIITRSQQHIQSRNWAHIWGKRRWVPLYTGGLEKFVADVERVAPTDNPFRTVLLNYRHVIAQNPQIQYLRFFVYCNFALSLIAISILGFLHFVMLR